MKITRIEPLLISIPYEHGAPKSVMSSGKVLTAMDALYLRVDTDAGITGWGEAFGFSACRATATIVTSLLAPLAVGREIGDIGMLIEEFQRRFQSVGRSGPGAFALAGLEIALWDIKGKLTGQPIHRMLGGAGRTSIPAYASLLRTGSVKSVERLVGSALDRGYRHIKLHEPLVEPVMAARTIAGSDIALMLDTNCAWGEEAIAMARRLEPCELAWLEEPIYPADDYEAMSLLRGQTRIPIAGGENLGTFNEMKWMMAAGAVDVIQPSVTRIGISRTWRTLALARERGVRGAPHAPYYGPGLIATLHLIAALPEETLGEFFFADLENSPLGDVIYPRDGRFAVPQGPGLGIEVDEDMLLRYRMT